MDGRQSGGVELFGATRALVTRANFVGVGERRESERVLLELLFLLLQRKDIVDMHFKISNYFSRQFRSGC